MQTNLQDAWQQHQAGDLDAAKKSYLAILASDPKNTETLHLLGILSAQQHNYAEAAAYLQQALQQQPHNIEIHVHLANAFKGQGLFGQAIQILHAALQLDSHCVQALNSLGTAYFNQGQIEDAIGCYRKAIAERADYRDAFYNLGIALTKKNQLDEAITVYKEILSLAPEHPAACFHIGCILMQKNLFQDAIEYFLLVAKQFPNHFETEANLATSYLKLGILNQAKNHYLTALELAPDDTQILYNIGVINTQLGHADSAIIYYQRLLKINPDDFSGQNNLAVAYLAKQHIGYALKHFKEALRLQPDNQAIQYTITALSQDKRLSSVPEAYVKTLFDAYADHYDQHLLLALDYKLPELLYQAVSTLLGTTPAPKDILDLGCGTGLCGAHFKVLANTLVGVDLSEKMLAIAKQKNIYQHLVASDILAFLQDKNASYDVILAGDVFVYAGDLAPLFKAIKLALRKLGFFAFNTETTTHADFTMNQSGRFSHAESYIIKLAADSGFTIAFKQHVPTRMQNNVPVPGSLYILTH